ncbi:insertion element protein [Providencia stuartii ATCC 25827]|uniref:Insertion element protein n=1 Tax=Providencia stuartii ATCC 25827 TaxID=471874 RepID=A0AA86YNE7_PROST|nr:insertion element protein [Providencia stuartii ATCC 25827]
MATISVTCRFCGLTDPVKKHGTGNGGHPRCRTFQLDYTYNACQPGIKEQVVELAMNNAGIRDTARALHISINAVVRTLKNSRHGM